MTGRTSWRGALWIGLGLVAMATCAWAAYIEEEFGGPPPPAPVPPRRPLPPSPPYPVPHVHPPVQPHVPELERYLGLLEIRQPIVYGRLGVVPVAVRGGPYLGGAWWTADAAMAKGILVVMETEGGGSVPVILMENRSRSDHVFVMAGEVVSGGKQTRTFRQDVILAPGQRIQTPVLCVEAHRWRGDQEFRGAAVFVPQSIQRALRKGADQGAVWEEVARNNAALDSENPTGSLELGLKAGPVQRRLDEVRRHIMPGVRADTVGFIFIDRFSGRGLGLELFGRTDLARALLPKLLDAYAVDFVLRDGREYPGMPPAENVAWDFLNRVRRAGSYRTETPGSGAGLGTRAQGLVGDGVSLAGDVVHYGCQVDEGLVDGPVGRPVRPMPRTRVEPEPFID